jgi:hypothetical protein
VYNIGITINKEEVMKKIYGLMDAEGYAAVRAMDDKQLEQAQHETKVATKGHYSWIELSDRPFYGMNPDEMLELMIQISVNEKKRNDKKHTFKNTVQVFMILIAGMITSTIVKAPFEFSGIKIGYEIDLLVALVGVAVIGLCLLVTLVWKVVNKIR